MQTERKRGGFGKVAVAGFSRVATKLHQPQHGASCSRDGTVAACGGRNGQGADDDCQLADSRGPFVSLQDEGSRARGGKRTNLPNKDAARKAAGAAGKASKAASRQATKMASAFAKKLRKKPQASAADVALGMDAHVLGKAGDEEDLEVGEASDSTSLVRKRPSSAEEDVHVDEPEAMQGFERSSCSAQTQFSNGGADGHPSTFGRSGWSDHSSGEAASSGSDGECANAGVRSNPSASRPSAGGGASSACCSATQSPARGQRCRAQREVPRAVEEVDPYAVRLVQTGQCRPSQCHSIWEIPTSFLPHPSRLALPEATTSMGAKSVAMVLPSIAVTRTLAEPVGVDLGDGHTMKAGRAQKLRSLRQLMGNARVRLGLATGFALFALAISLALLVPKM